MGDRRDKVNEQRITQRPAAYYRGCQGKKSYPSKRAALGVRNAMLAKSKTYDEWDRMDSQLRAYKCSLCHRWHLGNQLRSAAEAPESTV